MNRTALFGVGSAVVAMGMIVACQAIDGIHVYSVDDPETSVVFRDGGVVVVHQDGGVQYTGFGDAQCTLATPPPSPDPATVVNVRPDGEYVVAFSRLSFTGTSAALLGYDLDGVCTGEPTEGGTGSSSCLVADGGMAVMDSVGEAGDGVDSVLTAGGGRLESFFNGVPLDQLTNVQNDIDQGHQTAFLVIDEYNYGLNDSDVTVFFATAAQVESIGCEAPDADAHDHPLPQFDGCDTWGVDEATLFPNLPDGGYLPDGGGKQYRFYSQSAYVNNGVLVARFGTQANSAPLTLPVGSVSLSPSGVIIVAPLERTYPDGADGGPLQLRVTDGLIQGRLSAQTFLTSLGGAGDPLDPTGVQHICPGSPSFSVLQAAVCSQLDINSTLVDNGSAPCDAFTFASTFDGVTAILGTPVDGDAGTDGGRCTGSAPACP